MKNCLVWEETLTSSQHFFCTVSQAQVIRVCNLHWNAGRMLCRCCDTLQRSALDPGTARMIPLELASAIWSCHFHHSDPYMHMHGQLDHTRESQEVPSLRRSSDLPQVEDVTVVLHTGEKAMCNRASY